MPNIGLLYVVDADGTEIDRIEYDAGRAAPAVEQIQAALGVDQAAALAIVQEHNAEAAKTSQENAQTLAEQIAARAVPDRDPATYGAADAELSVTDQVPLARPVEGAEIVATPAADDNSVAVITSLPETTEESK